MLNNTLFYAYVEADEKDFMAIESSFDIDMARENLAYEYNEKLYDIKLQQSNLKVLQESGTFDDISVLYEAAGEEAGKRGTGIIKGIFERIGKFIQDVLQAVTKAFGKKEEDALKKAVEENKVSPIKGIKDPNKILEILKDGWKKVSQFLKPGFTVTDETGEKVLSIQKSVVTGIEAVGVTTLTGIAIMKLIGGAKTFLSDVEGNMWKVAANVTNTTVGAAAYKTISGVCSFIAKEGNKLIQSLLKYGRQALSAIGGAKDAVVSTAKKVVPKKGEAAPTEESVDDEDEIEGFLESSELTETCDDILAIIDAM